MKLLTVKVPEEEFDAFKSAITKEGQQMSRVVRQFIRHYTEARKEIPSFTDSKESNDE